MKVVRLLPHCRIRSQRVCQLLRVERARQRQTQTRTQTLARAHTHVNQQAHTYAHSTSLTRSRSNVNTRRHTNEHARTHTYTSAQTHTDPRTISHTHIDSTHTNHETMRIYADTNPHTHACARAHTHTHTHTCAYAHGYAVGSTAVHRTRTVLLLGAHHHSPLLPAHDEMRGVRVERRKGYSNEAGCVMIIASGTQCRAHSYPMLQRPLPEG